MVLPDSNCPTVTAYRCQGHYWPRGAVSRLSGVPVQRGARFHSDAIPRHPDWTAALDATLGIFTPDQAEWRMAD